MTRRLVVLLAGLAAATGALLLANLTTASAQVGLPGFDIAALLRAMFESLPAFLRSLLGPIFSALLSAFGVGCIPPFCASP